MSFLLDALGKADDDRRRAMVPELRASRYQRRSPGRRALGIVLMIVAVLSSFMLGYIARPYVERYIQAEPVIPSATRPAAGVTTKPVENAAATPPSMTKPDVDSAPVAVPSVSPEVQSGPASPPDSIELSVISYATQPEARFVMLDGVVMYEGDMLDEDIRLVLIKPDGVILERNGQAFSIDLGGPR